MVDFANITGPLADTFFESVGLPNMSVRFGGVVISPTPLISYDSVSSVSDPVFGLSSSESVLSYTVTIPVASLANSLGDYSNAILPDATWEVQVEGSWVTVKVLGEPQFNPTGERYQLKLVERGL